MRCATRPINGVPRPAHERRKSGYVTSEMIRRHGSFEKAVAVLNGEGA